jgi:hypothetical protein
MLAYFSNASSIFGGKAFAGWEFAVSGWNMRAPCAL